MSVLRFECEVEKEMKNGSPFSERSIFESCINVVLCISRNSRDISLQPSLIFLSSLLIDLGLLSIGS